MSWWVLDYWQSPGLGPIFVFGWAFWVILSITLHELGHGVAAIWQGDDTPIKSGHMTMNPLIHMGGFSLLAFAIVGIAWGAMPVNPYHFRNRRFGDALVSLAGPAVNLFLAIITATALGFAIHYGNGSNFSRNLNLFLSVAPMLNLVLLVLNLVPVPPLDGSRILAGISHSAARFYEKPEVQQFGVIALLLIVFSSGDRVFSVATDVSLGWADIVSSILP